MSEKRTLWLVGATYGRDDQYQRFIDEGLWQNGYKDKYLEQVKSIKVGESIAIKSSYCRKNDLPFDNHCNSVSTMAIKAIGVVTENMGDGRYLKVNWDPLEKPKEWYFYTYRRTVWKVEEKDWCANNLIAFVLDNVPQNIDRFRNDPFWKGRYGDKTAIDEKFRWTHFYEEIASKLLNYKDNRSGLIEQIIDISSRVNGLTILNDKLPDGSRKLLTDICPFTVMGFFNRGITDDNRKTIALELAKFLNVQEPVPESFESIPVLNNQKSWFFGYVKDRHPEDINHLWNIFEAALHLSDNDSDSDGEFIQKFDKACECKNVGWNLTMGLYWIRPWFYPTLDGQSRSYITNKLRLVIGNKGIDKRCSGKEYLELKECLEDKFNDGACPVHSFLELSLAAWLKNDSEDSHSEGNTKMCPTNTILYGPPGTGKTYNSINHAVALCRGVEFEEVVAEDKGNHKSVRAQYDSLCDQGRISFCTFHQSMSYEDFVEGIKPQTEGGKVVYPVVPGVFYEICDTARKNCESSKNVDVRSFEKVWKTYTQSLVDDDSDSISVETKRKSFTIYDVNERTVYFEKRNGNRDHSLSIRTLKRVFQNPDQLSALGGLQTYYRGLVDALKEVQIGDEDHEELQQFVLIIDEINRGNVSAILGELITLLEPDKRLGQNNELRVTLPYSKDSDFGVPPNLHIIGTMNTADRSVEALDTALRRRFSFIEMLPDTSLLAGIEIDGINLAELLDSINMRIEYLLDKDHSIGHSYFMNVRKREDLEVVFKDKIIPLFQEYFYGDYNKIGLVLGSGFVEVKDETPKFAGGDFDSDVADVKICTLLKPRNEEFINALHVLMNKQRSGNDE